MPRSIALRSLVFVVMLGQVVEVPLAFAQAATAPAAQAPLAESLTGMARAEYEAGRILYADGDYAGAALKFERAYQESNDPRLLWNIAAAEKNLRRYVRVYELIERYLKEGGAQLTEQDRAEAQTLLETVRAFIGVVTINVDQPGARIFVDDQELGLSPLPGPVRLEMGERKLRVEKPGFTPFVAPQNIPGGAESRIEVTLQREVNEGRLRVIASPGDTISIDGTVVGHGQWEGPLPSGIHSLQVTAPGKRPYQADVGVRNQQLSTVRVALEATPTEHAFAPQAGTSPWPWIAGGVLLAGLGVGAYFLFRPDDETTVRPPVTGSLDPGAIPLSVRF